MMKNIFGINYIFSGALTVLEVCCIINPGLRRFAPHPGLNTVRPSAYFYRILFLLNGNPRYIKDSPLGPK